MTRGVLPKPSHPVRALTDEREEFGAGFFRVAEASEHGAGDGGGVLLLDPAHHHAEVSGFDDDADALWFDDFLNGFRDLGCEPLLDLQAARE